MANNESMNYAKEEMWYLNSWCNNHMVRTKA